MKIYLSHVLYHAYNSQDMEAIQISISKHNGKHGTHIMGILLALTMKEFLAFATIWISLEDIMLNEIKEAQKGKYYMIRKNTMIPLT